MTGGISRALLWSFALKICALLALALSLGGLLAAIWLDIADLNLWFAVFCTIFVLRYYRFAGNLIGHIMYRPSPVKPDPAFTRHDVSVICPTIDPSGPDFQESIRSVLSSGAAHLFVITVGAELKAETRRTLRGLSHLSRETTIHLTATDQPNKRRQMAHAMPRITTSITILMDDHVFWPNPEKFIPSVLAPFENPAVGAVATKKRVRRTYPTTSGKFSWMSIVNFIACNYLERHTFELRSSNSIDGSVFVISGRTAVYRTSILADEAFLQEFCNEKFFFGLFPRGNTALLADDDNFLTRRVISQDLIRFQDTEDACVETTLGEWPKIMGQMARWSRTTFRSNPVLLRSPGFLLNYPWGYMCYWSMLINFALVWDAALLFTFVRTLQTGGASVAWITILILWILATKTIKVMPTLLRHPTDWLLLPFQFMFAYIHTAIKIWTLLTFWDCSWSGRNLSDVNIELEDRERRELGQFEQVVVGTLLPRNS